MDHQVLTEIQICQLLSNNIVTDFYISDYRYIISLTYAIMQHDSHRVGSILVDIHAKGHVQLCICPPEPTCGASAPHLTSTSKTLQADICRVRTNWVYNLVFKLTQGICRAVSSSRFCH